MSRTLSKLRRILDDPVLVRAGRAMVPTPRALSLQGSVRDLVEQARTVFTPPQPAQLTSLHRVFSIQVGEGLFSFNNVDEAASALKAIATDYPSHSSAARRIAEAYRQWGRGLHPAALNFGDCFAYEVAKEHACRLLFVGADFAKTDIEGVL